MHPLIRRGRAIVGSIVLTHLALAIGVILMALIMGRFDQLPRLGVRFLATATTVHGLWQGSRWAKWLYVLGFALGGGLLLFFATTLRPGVTWMVAGVGVLFCFLAWLVGFAPSVNHFLAYQRGARVLDEHEEWTDEVEVDVPVREGRLCGACGHVATSVNMLFCGECGRRIG